MSQRLSVILFFMLMLYGCDNQDKLIVDLGRSVDCDAAVSTCSVKKEGFVVKLSLGPDVHALNSFPLILDIEGEESDIAVDGVIADFQMQGMDMGINRYKLQSAEGKWQGSITLPVCTTSRMDWYAQIEFMVEGVQYRARFPFQVGTGTN